MSKHCPLAVVGVSAIFPGSTSATGFWKDILEGRDLVQDIPEGHWLLDDYYDEDPSVPDMTYGKRGAFLEAVDFDAMGFGIPPSVIPTTDTSQLLALIVAQRVLDDATGGQFASMDKEKISVILGVTSAQELLGDMVSRLQHPIWRKALRDMGLPESQVKEACERISSHYVDWKESTFPGLLGNVVAGRIANRLDLHGTNCVTDAACASTLSALTMAAHELYLGEADMVITGGVDTMNGIFMHMCFSKTPALSATGDCRPFSADGDGTLLGEGLGMFALRRLEDAERDGDTIYAVLKGIGTSSDGRSKAVYAPVSEGQARALRRAYENADFDTRTVELVEAHGTGTRAGDAAEFGGLVEAFGATSSDDRRWCALGSVKSQIGHTKAAAGAAGLFKIVMALHHKVLPPTLKIEQPNPKMDLDNSPFYLNTEARPWVRGPDHARRAGVSSFGFGGSNFHVAVEAYEGTHRAARRRTWPTEMMLLSADSAADLATEARTWADKLGAEQDMAWASFATCRDADGTKAHRLAVVAGSVAEATKTLRMAADRISKAPDTAWSLPDGSTYASGGREGKTALLFPGQGSQYVRMGAELAMNFESAMQVWDASAAHDGDMALHDVVFPVGVFSDADRDAQSDQLRATEWAQPALGVSSAATLAVLKDLGVHADASAGHSFGELTALYAAGAMDLDTFCRASRARGRAVADAAASSAGSMLAVRLPLEQLEPLLEGQSDVVMANHNHPEQVVLSGPTDKVAEFERMLTGKEIVCKMLPVATAFHSHVVADAEGAFAKALKGVSFEKPSWTVYENATGKAYSKNIAKSLARQLVSPVRWVDSLEAMYADGVRTFIEVGAHGVLTGLTERTLGERDGVLAVSTDRKGRHGVTQLLAAVAQLWAHGVAIQPAALWDGYEHPLSPEARPKPKLAVPVDGNNIGKPYPPEGGAKALPAPNPEVAPPEPVVVERVVEKVVEVPVAMPSNQPPTMERMAMVSTATPRPAPAPVGDVWIDAFQAAQHEASEAHAAYQRTMADAHLGFLGAMSTGLEQLAALAGAPVTPRAPMATHAAPMMAPVAPVMPQPAVPTPVMTPASPAMTAAPPVLAPPKAAPAAPVLAAPAPSVVATPAPVVTPPAPAAVAVDLTAVMLGVVSEKTGYPQEMLSLEMDLEADLGIDSIKRVEILSAVREREPNLPDVDAAGMTSLRTLQEIVDYMTPEGGFAASAPVAAAAPAAMPAGIDVQGVMLAVVAEKTGYPQDMLSLEMDLEADLGIDSIKRVEILSAVREREPKLPDVDAAGMTTLRTLQEIVDYMGDGLPALAAPTAGVSAAGGATAVDVQGVMLEVVAEKTGYPVDMISLEMDLEADLGVDSIKRVEILSSVREREPNLPEVDAAGMTSLLTLL
ncbi:MAG: beta-ketoacyl synthase N-terminal-like domain-containing protein [Myxococcota bacterium]